MSTTLFSLAFGVGTQNRQGDWLETMIQDSGPGIDVANIDKLLDALRDVDDDRRTAHFVCVLALLQHADDPQPIVVEGRWHGTLLRQRRGSGGHGYDPVFLDPAHGQTAAEMPMDLKNRISHRGRAMALLRERLIGSR